MVIAVIAVTRLPFFSLRLPVNVPSLLLRSSPKRISLEGRRGDACTDGQPAEAFEVVDELVAIVAHDIIEEFCFGRGRCRHCVIVRSSPTKHYLPPVTEECIAAAAAAAAARSCLPIKIGTRLVITALTALHVSARIDGQIRRGKTDRATGLEKPP